MNKTTINWLVAVGLVIILWYMAEENTTLAVLAFLAIAYLLFANNLIQVA
jgi:hypothetical protein